MTVLDRDRGWREMGRRVRALSGARGGVYTLVGVQGSEGAAQHGNSGSTVAEIATVHEFGARIRRQDGSETIIPQRSFVRGTLDAHGPALQRLSAALGQAVVEGRMSERQAVGLLGEAAVGMIKQRIADGIAPPNAPSTAANKSSSTPLIDKGQLRNSITHRPEGL